MELELFMTILLMTWQFSLQQDLCLEVDKMSVCSGNSSTWAYDTPYINITHRVSVTVVPLFAVSYSLTLEDSNPSILCTYQFNSDGTCKNVQGSFCIEDGCTNYYSVNGTVVSKFSITGLDGTKNQSLLEYSLVKAGLNNQFLQRLSISECSATVDDATATSRSSNPCGYGCTSRFDCNDGYEFQSASSQSTIYQCEADAKWNINETLCIPKVTTTATMVVTTTDKETSDPGGLTWEEICAIVFSIIIVLSVGFFLGLCYCFSQKMNSSENSHYKKAQYSYVSAAVVAVICIVILFEVEGSEAGSIVSAVFGTLSEVLMVIINVYFGREVMPEAKGIRGKESEAENDL